MSTVAFDTETRGLNWFDPDERAFLASWADADGEYVADLSDPEQAIKFVNALESADTLVCHNLSFDAHMVRATLGYDVLANGHTCEDTDLMSRVIFPEGQRAGERGGHGLKNLAKVYLRADAADSEDAIKELAKSAGIKLKSTGGYYDTWRAYPAEMERYALQDARHTYDLYQLLSGKLNNGSARCYDLERQVAPVLIRAEEHGVAIDQQAVINLKRLYEAQLYETQDILEKELGEEALGGPGSEEALLEALQKLGVPLHRKTPTGQLATNIYALQEFEQEFWQLATLSEYRQASKFLSTYIGPMVDRDTVHPSFRQCGAWTGRMSCTRPNMQNIPKRAGKEMRAMFVPREGYSFVVCDYDSIEVRLLAHYLNDSGYRELISDGLDPHAWMAANIHGGAVEDYHKGTDGEEARNIAKNTLFAIVYGAGAPRVSDMNKITRDEAKALISKIKASLPRYNRLQGRIRKKIQAQGFVNTLFGRKNPVSRDKAYVGLNALIQGSAADIMKQGLVNVDEAVREHGARPLLVVHDEIVVEAPSEYAEEVLMDTEHALRDAYDLDPPLAVTGTVVHDNYASA